MGLPGYCPRKGKRSTWGAAAYQNSIYARDNSYGASIFDFNSHAIGGKNFKVQGTSSCSQTAGHIASLLFAVCELRLMDAAEGQEKQAPPGTDCFFF